MATTLQDAASLIRSWGAVVIIGAGSSVASGLPLTKDLTDLVWHALDSDPETRPLVAQRLGVPDQAAKTMIGTEQDRIKLALEYIEHHSSARKAYQLGFAALDRERAKQHSACHDILARLTHVGRAEIVISLNWDTQFESSYRRLYGINPSSTIFHKPHGDAARPDIPWVLPHEPGRIPDTLVAQLRSLVAERPRVLLIVGYSERDDIVVQRIVHPLEQRWRVFRVSPNAIGPGALTGSGASVLPELFAAMELPDEVPGWNYVSFEDQRDLSAALVGRRLGPSDVNACPRFPEVKDLSTVLKRHRAACLTGASGTGKSLTAYQCASDFVVEGWEVLRSDDSAAPTDQILSSVRNLRNPTLLLIDDVQRVDPKIIRRLGELVSDSLMLLCVGTPEDDFEMTTVPLNEKEAVSELTRFVTQRRAETLKAIAALDNHVGERYGDVRIEFRIQEASQSKTPWEFMFTLTGGWRRTREQLEALRKPDRYDLLLLVIAIRQIVLLDGPVEIDWLNQARTVLNRPKGWVDAGLVELKHRRLLTGDGLWRCPHRRFAAAVIELFGESNHSEDWDQVTKLLLEGLKYRDPSLRGMSWLLREVRLEDISHTRKDFLEDVPLKDVFSRVFAADTPVDRRDALFLLDTLINWNREYIKYFRTNKRTLTSWLTNVSRDYAAAFGSLLNQVRQRDKPFAKSLIQAADAAQIGRTLASEQLSAAADWNALLQETYACSTAWRKKLSKELTFEYVKELACSAKPSEAWLVGELLEALYFVKPRLAWRLLKARLSFLGRSLSSDPVRIAPLLTKSVFWRLLGYYPDFLVQKRPTRAQIVLAKSLAKQLDTTAIARALDLCRPRDWEEYSRFLGLVQEIDRPTWTRIVSRINIGKLEDACSELWGNVPHELENLLKVLACSRDFEPARSIIANNAGRIKALRPILVILSPHAAVQRLREGVKLRLGVYGGSSWPLASIALAQIAARDMQLCKKVVSDSIEEIASGMTRLQELDAEDFPRFLGIVEEIDSLSVEAAIHRIDPMEAKRYWLNRASGNSHERRALKALLKHTTSNTELVGLAKEANSILRTSRSAQKRSRQRS